MDREKENNVVKIKESGPTGVIIFIMIVSAVVIYAGYRFYQAEAEQIRSQKETTLASIATLKANQIMDWYLDELFDADVITQNSILRETAISYVQDATTADSSSIVMMLNQIKVEHHYEDIFLATMEGNILAGTSSVFSLIDSIEQLGIERAAQSGGSVSTDLFKTEFDDDQRIYITFISAIYDENELPILAMVYRFDSDQYLYPLIESWPVPSQTAESFFFRVEGDSVLYLNNLRHQENAALTFSLPVTHPDLPAAAVADGFRGIYRGIDYRGENVISFVTNIEGTPWYLVSKIDESELFEEVPGIFWSVMGLVLLGILFSTAAMGFIYNRRQKLIYIELYGKEKKLWQQMEEFKVTMDSLGEGVIITDLNAKVRYLNNQAEELTGWRNSEAQGRSLHEIYSVRNEETGLIENNILDKVIKHGIVKELGNHTLLVKKNGETIPVVDTGAPVLDPEGNLNGIVITFQDETEKRNRQKQLEENELQFRNLFEFSADAVFIADAETGIIMNANQAAESLLDMPREKIIGLHQMSLYQEEKADYSKEIFQKAVENLQERDVTEVVEHEVVREDGTTVPVEILASKVVYKGKNCLMGTFRNISERKKYEAELQKLSMAIEQSPSSIIITNIDGDIEYVNPALTSITGYSKAFVLGKNPRIFNSGLQSRDFYRNLWETITSSSIWRGEMCNRKKSGELYWELASISPVKNRAGIITNFIAVKEDITERKLAEDRIRENEKYLESLFKSVPDTIIVLNKKGEILDFNSSSMDYMPGINQTMREQLESLLPQEINKLQIENSVKRQQDRQVVSFQFELTVEDVTYHFSARSVLFGDDKVIVTLSDISETIQNFNRINALLQVEEEQSKQMQSFTHIVSHNLRSHTANMEGLFDVLAMEEPKLLENQYIQLIKESSSDLQETIGHLNQILDVNVIKKKGWKRIDLKLIVKNSINIISNFSEERGVSIYNRVPEETWVYGIPAYLESIVLNLLTNAVKFRSDNRESFLKIRAQKEENFTIISFEDNGLGIDLNRHKEKLFGMYKTFHDHHDSRGLGLFMTKTQVEAMDGKIEVESKVGEGSTFKVYLPNEKD